MSDKKKISILLLENESSLKTHLLETDPGKTEEIFDIHESNIQEVLSNCPASHQSPDMCLVVLQDRFSTEAVWRQIYELHKETEIPREVIRLVLPRYCTDTAPSSSLFRIYTVEEIRSQMHKLAEERNQPVSTNKRPSDEPSKQIQGGRSFKERALEGIRVNLVLLGMAGAGKSASGNTILRNQHFKSRASANQVTTECQMVEDEIDGIHIRVIDTPDVFDEEIMSPVREKHVMKCKKLCQSEPCVYLLVMQVGRFTDGERDIMKKLERAFGKVRHQTIILFTCAEELQRAGMTLEEFLGDCQPDLKKIVEKCENRCVLFQNKYQSPDQVKELMKTVRGMLKTQRK